MLFSFAGKNFPQEGSLSFSIQICGNNSNNSFKITDCLSLPVTKICVAQAFHVYKQNTPEHLYLKCSHTSLSGVQSSLGTADIILPKTSLDKKVSILFFSIFVLTFCLSSFNSNYSCYFQWYDLAKNSNNIGPSVCVSITFFKSSTGDTPNQEPSAYCSTQSNYHSILPTPVPLSDPLIPTLVNNEYFLLGEPSEDESQSLYTLSITLAFVENLLSLFPPDKELEPTADMPLGFEFQMLGQAIHMQWDMAEDMYNVGERATARLLCTPSVLLKYLKQSMANFIIGVCYEDIVMSETVIPIEAQIDRYQAEQKILNGFDLEEVNICGIYPMKPLFKSNCSIVMPPKIGIKIFISKFVQNNATSSFALPHNDSPFKYSLPIHPSGSVKPLSNCQTNLTTDLKLWREEQDREKKAYLGFLNNEYPHKVSVMVC